MCWYLYFLCFVYANISHLQLQSIYPQHPGRTLVFVNSIKTARRLDGLLRALELNCRTIHAQLQQRQRLRALESYQASSTAILVATDVAARGLDINKIQYVIHYDVARSPQVGYTSLYFYYCIILF